MIALCILIGLVAFGLVEFVVLYNHKHLMSNFIMAHLAHIAQIRKQIYTITDYLFYQPSFFKE